MNDSNFFHIKEIKKVYFILGAVPYGFIIPLLTFFFYATFILGRFPFYSSPDPKEIPSYHIFLPIIDFASSIMVGTFLSWFIFSVIYLITSWKNVLWKSIFLSSLGYIICILLFFSSITDWWAD